LCISDVKPSGETGGLLDLKELCMYTDCSLDGRTYLASTASITLGRHVSYEQVEGPEPETWTNSSSNGCRRFLSRVGVIVETVTLSVVDVMELGISHDGALSGPQWQDAGLGNELETAQRVQEAV
jgi:hypothetical protein